MGKPEAPPPNMPRWVLKLLPHIEGLGLLYDRTHPALRRPIGLAILVFINIVVLVINDRYFGFDLTPVLSGTNLPVLAMKVESIIRTPGSSTGTGD